MPHRLMVEDVCVICWQEEQVYKAGPYRGCCAECTVLAQENPD